MPFSAEEKAKILHFLGYPTFGDYGGEVGFGAPGAPAVADLVHRAFDKLNVHGEQLVRTDLRELACIELELGKLRPKAAISRTSDISFDIPGARRMLMGELRRYTQQLAADLGAPVHPAHRFGGGPRVVNT